MGGSCATINPLPMSAFVDVFALGAAENLLPALLPLLEEETASRDAVLERLAASPGFYVPAFHRPEDDLELQSVAGKLRKLELSAEQMQLAGAPAHQRDRHAAHRVRRQVPDRDVARLPREVPLLLGDLRHGHLPLAPRRLHPGVARARRGRSPTSSASSPPRWAITPRSSASSDEARRLGFRTSVSSIRIPAVTEPVLRALHASGDRSITLAPETGTDELRVKMGKPIPNSFLLEKIRLIFEHGFTQLKLYFIIGLPEETDDDVAAILELGRQSREIMLAEARKQPARSATSTSASTS